MPIPPGERLATIEQMLRDAADDRSDLRQEALRARQRLHEIESTVAALVNVQQVARSSEERQYKRLELRLQVLTIAVGLATVLVPIMLVLLTGR